MTIEWYDWRIRSNEFGFIVERRINPKRWKAEWYLPTLESAAKELLNYRIRTETVDYVLQAYNDASARVSTAKLIKKIDSIATEITEVLDDNN